MNTGVRVALTILVVGFAAIASGQEEAPARSLDQWIRLLESDDPAVRLGALETLQHTGTNSSNLVLRLQKMVRSDSASAVRAKAVCSLVVVDGTHDGNAELFLETLRDDENLAVRLSAAHAIAATDRSGDEVVVALNRLSYDLSADADFSNELEKWVWRIGLAVLVGIIAVVTIGAIRYIVFRDLRRTLITASLALAFLPQVGMTILTLMVEYWLYGEDRGPGVVAVVGAISSAAVIVFAMFFIDRQDARRQSTVDLAADNEWSILSKGIESFCGHKLTPSEFIRRIVRNFSIPQEIVTPKNWDDSCCKAITVGVRSTMLKLIGGDILVDDAASTLAEAVKPHRLGRYEAIQLITCAKHYLSDV